MNQEKIKQQMRDQEALSRVQIIQESIAEREMLKKQAIRHELSGVSGLIKA